MAVTVTLSERVTPSTVTSTTALPTPIGFTVIRLLTLSTLTVAIAVLEETTLMVLLEADSGSISTFKVFGVLIEILVTVVVLSFKFTVVTR